MEKSGAETCRQRPQSQDPLASSALRLGKGTPGAASYQLTNYSMLIQQQTKQSEEVYALKFQLRQAQSELDKHKALHQQDVMQLKNRVADIVEQKDKSQQINDMMINSLRAALQNQANSVSIKALLDYSANFGLFAILLQKSYLVEFDYVWDMVRMFSNEQKRRRESFIQTANAQGTEPSLEDIKVKPMELRTISTQTQGDECAQEGLLTWTPKELELLEQLQQLEKASYEGLNSKNKFESQKAELASKLKELARDNSELSARFEQIGHDKAELERLVEFMKNAGYNQEQNLMTDSQSKQSELKNLCEQLQAKYLRKKRQAKERKHAFKAEIQGLKRQLADALRQASAHNDQVGQLKKTQLQAPSSFVTRPLQKEATTTFSHEQPYDDFNKNQSASEQQYESIQAVKIRTKAEPEEQQRCYSTNQENLKATTARRAMKNKINQQLSHVSQFGATQNTMHLPLDTDQFSSVAHEGSITSRSRQNSKKDQLVLKPANSVATLRSQEDQSKQVVAADQISQRQQQSGIALKKQQKSESWRDYRSQQAPDNTSSSRQSQNQLRTAPEQKHRPSSKDRNPVAAQQPQQPLTELAVNQEQGAFQQLKSHAKLFSKFVNISKEQQQQKSQSFATFLTRPRGSSADSNTQGAQPSPAKYSLCTVDSIVKQPAIDHFKMLSPRDLADSQQYQMVAVHPMIANSGQQLQHFYEESVADAHEQPKELTTSARPTPTNHAKKLTAATQMIFQDTSSAAVIPYNTNMEDSIDQLVRIEASPTHPITPCNQQRTKKQKKNKIASQFKVSPERLSPGSKSPRHQSSSKKQHQNKHLSPCRFDEITKEQAKSILQMQTAKIMSLAPVTKLDLTKHSKKLQVAKGSKSPKNQRKMKAYKTDQQEKAMLVEEQSASEGRSCSIDHHNVSSSSIEGMIKLGGLRSFRAANGGGSRRDGTRQKANYKSPQPQQQRKLNQLTLNRSKSPSGVERDQIASIIDEITNQLQEAQQLSQRRSNQGKSDVNTSSEAEKNSPFFCQTQRHAAAAAAEILQENAENPMQPLYEHFKTMQHAQQYQGSQQSTYRQVVPHLQLQRDASYQETSCGGGTTTHGICTHYHNHFGQGGGGDAGAIDVSFTSRLVQQCFDKIGQSLDQLATKDRLIQQLINDKTASERKKTGLRQKLKHLRATLQQCQQEEKSQTLEQENVSLSFENEHLRDKVEKTKNLLRMYELDSPRLQDNPVLMKSRSSSQYDLEKLRKMAKFSFQQTWKGKDQNKNKTGLSYPNMKLELGGSKHCDALSTNVLLTDRHAAERRELKDQAQFAQQRQQLLKSMVHGSRHQSSQKRSSQALISCRSAEKLKPSDSRGSRSNKTSALKPNKVQMSTEAFQPLKLTQKLQGLESSQAYGQTGSFDTRCESNEFLSHTMATRTNPRSALTQQPSFTSNEHIAPKAKLRPGYLPVSKHQQNQNTMIISQQQQQQQRQMPTKSPRQRYVEADEDDCFLEEQRSSIPNSINATEDNQYAEEPTVRQIYDHQNDSHYEDVGDYDLPSRAMGIKSLQKMKQNDLGQMHTHHSRKQVVQAFDKVIIIERGHPSSQPHSIQTRSTQSDHAMLFDSALRLSQHQQHPKKRLKKEQSPVIDEEDSDRTQPDLYFTISSRHDESSSASRQNQQQSLVSPRNFYYKNNI